MAIALGSLALALTQVTSFATNPGNLAMYEYVPSGMPPNAPLVVLLHGCSQNASGMTPTGFEQLAEEKKFYLVLPQTNSDNNPISCFNWAGEYGDPANMVRGQGENQSIASMIDYEATTHGIDRTKVYIMGFSAGAAFVEVMLATWPEKFAAGSIMEGVPYRCATTVNG